MYSKIMSKKINISKYLCPFYTHKSYLASAGMDTIKNCSQLQIFLLLRGSSADSGFKQSSQARAIFTYSLSDCFNAEL